MSSIAQAERQLRMKHPMASREELAAKMMQQRFPGSSEEAAQEALLQMLTEVTEGAGGDQPPMTFVEGNGPGWMQRMNRQLGGGRRPPYPDLGSAIDNAVMDMKRMKRGRISM